jgi:arginase
VATLELGLIGVPSSAGAMTPGIEKAPSALRVAGVAEMLRAAGHTVHDHGDLPLERWRPDPANPTAQNLDRVTTVARRLADRVAEAVAAGQVPLVLGGDCTVTVGAVAGCVRHRPDIALLYIDGGLDLTTPRTTTEKGHMDAMGVAHMLGEPGVAEPLARIGPRVPLLRADDVIYVGNWEGPADHPEEQVRRRHGMTAHPASVIRGRARHAAGQIVVDLETRARPFLVHLDVDVIDHLDFPIADIPAVHDGLTLGDAMAVLAVVARSEWFAGLVVTEVNPDHTTPETGGVPRLAMELARALAA